MTQSRSKSNTSSSTPKRLPVPRAFRPLLASARYKGIYGGRGSGKSHFFAGQLVERAISRNGLRWVCIREIQNSLDQSVKRIIEDKIAGLEVGDRFRIKESTIETPGGGLILFRGMQNHTAENLKSLEGYDGAWVEEAQSLSAKSLRLLRPTIRKARSELWFSWNPASPEDSVDRLLRGAGGLKGAVVVEANWRDNPWFEGTELDAERQADLARGAEDYEHVWEGAYRSLAQATVFARHVVVERFETPEDARFFLGADWGFASDPTVLVRGFVQDECLFVDHAVYGYRTELDGIAALFDRVPLARIWPIKADSSRPETISHVRARGFDIQPAEKWPGSVEDGIGFLKGFKRIVIHERCPELAREARLYSYKVDTQTEEVLPVLLDRHNHGWDALRYALGRLIRRRGAVREVDINIHA